MSDLFFEIKSGNITKKIPIGFSFDDIKKRHLIMDMEVNYTKVEDISVSEKERAQSLADDLIAKNYTELVSKNFDFGLSYLDKIMSELPVNYVLSNNELIYNLDPQVKTLLEDERKEFSNLYCCFSNRYCLFRQCTFTDKLTCMKPLS